MFSTVAVQTCIPTSSCRVYFFSPHLLQGSFFGQVTLFAASQFPNLQLNPCPVLFISCLFDKSHSSRGEVISNYGSDFHFPDDY